MKRLLAILLLTTIAAFATDVPVMPESTRIELLTMKGNFSDIQLTKVDLKAKYEAEAAKLKAKYEADLKTLDTEAAKVQKSFNDLIKKNTKDGFTVNITTMTYEPVKPPAVPEAPKAAK